MTLAALTRNIASQVPSRLGNDASSEIAFVRVGGQRHFIAMKYNERIMIEDVLNVRRVLEDDEPAANNVSARESAV